MKGNEHCAEVRNGCPQTQSRGLMSTVASGRHLMYISQTWLYWESEFHKGRWESGKDTRPSIRSSSPFRSYA